jgi:hypothetical protein
MKYIKQRKHKFLFPFVPLLLLVFSVISAYTYILVFTLGSVSTFAVIIFRIIYLQQAFRRAGPVKQRIPRRPPHRRQQPPTIHRQAGTGSDLQPQWRPRQHNL